MSQFVLVHGGAHGAWCWERVVPYLEADAHVEGVHAVDLSGHGVRKGVKPIAAITRADYVDDIVGDVEARGWSDVVLVGHSLAGISLPLVAERIPQRLRHLVFLSTTNPPPGKSVNDVMAEDPRSPIHRGGDFEALFCNDLSPEASQWLLANLCEEPPGPMAEACEPVRMTQRIPSTYVLLERDATLPPDYQRDQARTLGISDVVRFDSGHSAFASRPRDLATLLLGFA